MLEIQPSYAACICLHQICVCGNLSRVMWHELNHHAVSPLVCWRSISQWEIWYQRPVWTGGDMRRQLTATMIMRHSLCPCIVDIELIVAVNEAIVFCRCHMRRQCYNAQHRIMESRKTEWGINGCTFRLVYGIQGSDETKIEVRREHVWHCATDSEWGTQCLWRTMIKIYRHGSPE